MSKENEDRWNKNYSLYKSLIDSHPKIELKGKNFPYTSINGHMFSILDKEGNLGLRLPKEVRGKIIRDFNTQLHEAYGKVMKEYVHVPDKLLAETVIMKNYIEISFTYVKSLKPKPTKKK